MSEQQGRETEDTIRAAVGAIVFASDEPVPPKEIALALEIDVPAVEEALSHLASHFEAHALGLRIEHVAGGARLATRPDVGAFVRQFFKQRNRTRLSPAALETLAIVAYRQPVTAPEIQAIRGKDPSAALKGLLERDLVRCDGRKKVVGNPMLYGTSRTFLVHFGLNSLEDLPSIEEFDQFLEVLGARQDSVDAEQDMPRIESEAMGETAPGELDEPCDLSGVDGA